MKDLKLKSVPKELFVEILDYLADYEHLEGLRELLAGDVTLLDVRNALRELSSHLRKGLSEEKKGKSLSDYRKGSLLSSRAKQVLQVLSPGDERKLLDRFGLLDD